MPRTQSTRIYLSDDQLDLLHGLLSQMLDNVEEFDGEYSCSKPIYFVDKEDLNTLRAAQSKIDSLTLQKRPLKKNSILN